MIKLYIGDPHVQVKNLEEFEKFMHWLVDYLLANPVDRIVILGDIFHTHSVLRMEVIDFWSNWLETLSEINEIVVLVGNHDMQNSKENSLNALSIFNKNKNKNLQIIEFPTVLAPFKYMPYYHDRDRFVELANHKSDPGANVLVCHQTFAGSAYENGFYAPDGINPDNVNFDLIISGHVHRRQRFGKVIYPGTPRWDSILDANEPKGLWRVTHDDSTGAIMSEEFIDTSHICIPMFNLTWEEGTMCPEIPEGSKTVIELVGSSEWISKQKQDLKSKVGIRTKITDKEKKENRTTGKSLCDFILTHYETTAIIDRLSILKYLKEIGLE